MKAITLVAHPDDCVIFAYHFMNSHPEFDWEIVYMTYSLPDKRAEEMQAFWSKRNISVTFLGFVDNPMDIETGMCSINDKELTAAVEPLLIGADLLLTHSSSGEYGHPHHIVVNAAVSHLSIPKVYFADGHQYNVEHTLPEAAYSLDELPEHRFVIEMFNDRHLARYTATEEALKLL